MTRVHDLAATAVFNSFDISDGLDQSAANVYATAATEAVRRRVARIILSYEPIHGSSVFDLTRAILDDIAYDEVKEDE